MTDAKDIFLRAIECTSPNERAQLIDEACGDNAGLKRRVETLLAAHDDPDSYLERPAARFDVTATHDDSGSNLSASSSSHHGRFLPGTKVAGRYRIVSMLGRGGMGEVYRADDLRLGQTVALKFLPPELAKDAKRLEYFHNEVRLARQIAHPNVCRVYDIGEVDGQHFISMEYIDGEDLKTLLHRIGRVPADKGVQIAQQLCSGLAAAHAKGVLHRDLKPANIMIDGQGQVRITDFGLATFTGDGENIIGMSGTPAYMAPEQLLRGLTSVQSDIYSLGLVLFEVFTGNYAHKAQTLAELRQLHAHSSSVEMPSTMNVEMEPAVERAISRCLASDVADRPASVGNLMLALPGADPLTAALVAGDTPAPELVAAAGDQYSLSPVYAWSCFAATVVGLIALMFIAQRALLINQVDDILEPEVLRYRAERMLQHFGYDKPAHSNHIAYGFLHKDKQSENGEIAKLNGLKSWPVFGFWYRASDQEFNSETMGYELNTSGPARIDEFNPIYDFGMRGVRLDSEGKLLQFRALAKRGLIDKSVSERSTETPWNKWFPVDFTGFDLANLNPAEPTRVPPVQFDKMQSWNGLDEDVEVVAASFQGNPVYFDLLPKTIVDPRDQKPDQSFVFIVRAIILMNVVAIILVLRNIYLGRWDRRGAWRLFVCMFVVGLISRLFCAYHVSALWERVVVHVCIASAFVWAAELWLYYVSFEPIVRRWWPTILISWSRLLAGRVFDARVGADILLGVTLGTLHSALILLPSTFDGASPTYVNSDSLMGMCSIFGQSLIDVFWSTYLVLICTVLLTLVKIVIRSKHIAAVCVLVVLGVAHSLDSQHLSHWILSFLADGVLVFAVVRHGLLTAIVVSLVGKLSLSPLTTNVSAFYFPYGFFSLILIASLGLFGVIAATNFPSIWNRKIRRLNC